MGAIIDWELGVLFLLSYLGELRGIHLISPNHPKYELN